MVARNPQVRIAAKTSLHGWLVSPTGTLTIANSVPRSKNPLGFTAATTYHNSLQFCAMELSAQIYAKVVAIYIP